ncbi:Putative adhesin [Nonomuraea jiangxiensis]|uniref:Putative adhesin n=2 Tax=Nonomuraea jiangxiensis TaxID=633440 RepID=A0A1G9F7D1_9ACTN|nr:Putative adhesin [Nonomuraea jiangxiensis]
MSTFDTPVPIVATIDMATATIRINASDRADTVVEVRPNDEFNDADVRAAQHTHVYYANGRLTVRTDREQAGSAGGWGLSFDKLMESPTNWARSLVLGPGSVDVTIDLPAGSRVDAKAAASLHCQGPLGEVSFTTSYGDIQVEQAGRLRLKSTHGNISVSRATGHTDVTATNGDIRIGEIDGTAVVRTSHGDVRLGEVTGELRLNSAHGDTTVDRALAGVVAKTAYGSIRIGEVASGSVVVETTGGGLELGIRQGTAAWLDVSSKYGSVDVSLDSSDGPGQADQVVEVRAHTAYGDIVIHRS